MQKQQQHKLRLLAKRGGASLGLFLEWDSNVLGMSPAMGALVASTLDQILSGLLTSTPDTTLGALECMSRANWDHVREWNEQYPIQPVERCVHEVVGDRVLERPDAEAVCAWDGSLTFRELDVVAGIMAAQLIELGVGPEVFVPLCFEKSVRVLPIFWSPAATPTNATLEMDDSSSPRGSESGRGIRVIGPIPPI